MNVPRRLASFQFSELFLEELARNREMMQAYVKAMGRYIVLSSTYDVATACYQQVVFDALGKLPEVPEGKLLPKLMVHINKLLPATLDEPSYTCTVKIK